MLIRLMTHIVVEPKEAKELTRLVQSRNINKKSMNIMSVALVTYALRLRDIWSITTVVLLLRKL